MLLLMDMVMVMGGAIMVGTMAAITVGITVGTTPRAIIPKTRVMW